MKLDTQAQKERLKRANNSAGLRYNRAINLEVQNIKRNLQALNREPEYLAELFKLTRKAEKALLYHNTDYPDKTKELEQLRKNIKSVIDKLLSLKTKSKNENISWNILARKLEDTMQTSYDFYWFLKDLQEKERQEKGEYAKTSIETSPTWSLYVALNDLLNFIKNGVKINLFSTPRMILTGEAGIGKTHLLCDYANSRINFGKPTLIFLSDELASIEDTNPTVCMAKLMGYTTSSDFLKDLRSLANSSPERVCLIIDAINEADAIKWSQLSELFDIKGLSLAISVRNGYEKMIPNRKRYSTIEHFGFSEMEWAAVSTFFKHYKMKMPEIPIINPEFRNPLFLMIFCEAYANAPNKTFKGKGATHVFEQYVIKQSKKIAKELNINLDEKNYLWWNVIKQIGIWMGQNKTSVISHYKILKIIEAAPKLSSHASELLKLMEKYGLLLRYPRYGKRVEYKYKFTYNRFSDHLIVRSLLTENKINSKVDAQNFFADGTFLDENIHNVGLLEALSIQIPERCKKDKVEFVWVIPEKYRGDYRIKTAFLNGVKWRDVELDGFDKKTGKASYINESQIKEYINTYVNDSVYDLYQVMDCLFDVAVVPNHPLNALRLHEILNRTNLAERDSWFQSYMLNATSKQGNAISRIQSWSISKLPKDISDPKAILLTGMTLAWTLSSTDNDLRDRSTRALIQLFRYHQDVLVKLLDMFINTDDPYIIERLFAVVYGVVSLNPHNKAEFKSLAVWIYKNHFLNKNRRPDALLDDYAKGLIELYIRKYEKDIHVDLSKIKPPFIYYEFPNDIPSIDILRRKYDRNDNYDYYSIWSSLMYGEGGAALADFGNYTVGSYLSGFTNIPLSKKLLNSNTSRKDFDRFRKSLSKRQKKLLEGYESKKLLNRLSFNVIQSTVVKQKISDDEVTQALNNFENSLSPSKKREYKKYKLYIVGEKNFTKDFEDYDINIARRWMMDRIIKLGWNPGLHKEYDRGHGIFDRLQNSNVERIGKKYQWIALYEFLAMIG